MSTPTDTKTDGLSELPEAQFESERRLSLVWLIPLVALLAAAWLGYRAYMEQGPLVTITFQSAEGLDAGKTPVRFKDVDIGVVETIDLSDDLDRVLVHVRLNQSMTPYLNDKARFWVVRPRLSRGQISGLGTLVGGPFIAADLAAGDQSRDSFDGLEVPPVVTASAPGGSFTLLNDTLGSLSEGSPVTYRGIEVGRVVAYELRGDQVAIHIFIDAPHDAKVDANTRFWNASGVGLALDADGVRVHTDSLASVLRGGIAFGGANGGAGVPVSDGKEFVLYADRQAAMARQFHQREEWRLRFSGSIRGLVAGAPVEFRGIRIGEVADFRLELDVGSRSADIPVTIAIEPGRIAASDEVAPNSEERRQLWDELVEKGLRAQLKTGNLLTGALFVDFDFYPGAPARSIDWSGPRPELPTMPTPLDELSGLMTKIARLPLDSMGEDLATTLAELRETMAATNALLSRLDRETASELNKTLVKTRRTLGALEKTLAPNSPLQSEARRVLQELGTAARSLRIMADFVERHPEALLRGKGDGQ